MTNLIYKALPPLAIFIVVSLSSLLFRKIDSPKKLNFSSIEHKLKYHELKYVYDDYKSLITKIQRR